MTIDDLKHAQRERLIFLDQCLTWRGMANRRDLIDRFGISMAQAALDFRLYLRLARKTPPVYDAVRKTYLAADTHRPLAPSGLLDAFGILTEDGEQPGSSLIPRPERRADPKIVARIYQAIQAGAVLHIRYTSMSSASDEDQWIAPVRFVSDGESVHVRAFSLRHKEYRHYLPIRIDQASSFQEKDLADPLPDDADWNTKAVIWLRPKTGLSRRQADAVRREYGFDGPHLRVEVRKALEFFFDRRWGLDLPGARLERAKTEYEDIEGP
ncbi:MAG TPA: hypothetical protein DCL54_09155 [Alphaproteobacteria bacterium]|nr:hypothetical protein [Alphaproteobacteria bacterium]